MIRWRKLLIFMNYSIQSENFTKISTGCPPKNGDFVRFQVFDYGKGLFRGKR